MPAPFFIDMHDAIRHICQPVTGFAGPRSALRCRRASIKVLDSMRKSSFRPPQPSTAAKALPSLAQARRQIQKRPNDAGAWKMLGAVQLQAQQPDEARQSFLRATQLADNDHEAYRLLGETEQKLGNFPGAERALQRALELNPENVDALGLLAFRYYESGKASMALELIERAESLAPANNYVTALKANILARLFRYDEAIVLVDRLIERDPRNYSHWNNAGNLRRDLGLLDEADVYYRKSIELPPYSEQPFSNRITAMHYNPRCSREAIFEALKEWETRYGPKYIPQRPTPEDRRADRRLRIGMISDGFRNHPVGRMIVSTLENLDTKDVELFAYNSNSDIDPLTARINRCVRMSLIMHMDDAQLAQRIRDDRIDILIDLAGHNAGSRSRVMAMQPAPLQLKWVGGLINTTGLHAMDYLLSDAIESPVGDDAFYTEKLIRMPGDYICYQAPEYTPPVSELPAISNGYITLGCFNNPTKVNEVLLAEWAGLMRDLPGSRLFLKGMQYNSETLCQRIRQIMAGHGIEAQRLLIEGPASAPDLLKAYSRVDIALDPWPYSGGLTTCEALLMGVPVVTLPGPTFAGRHSATHLVNAGMPELVVDDWEGYRARVIELASDLDSLATIRRHLREVLVQSPLCDAPRFARHFTDAMRAIWQRYCEGKSPAALTLDAEGHAWFEGESEPMLLRHPAPPRSAEDFSFAFEGKIITLDHGGVLAGGQGFPALQAMGAFATIAFDPCSVVKNAAELQGQGELHHYPHVALGNGEEATLYTCLDPAMTGTLEPLPAERQLPNHQQGTQVLARLPITTLRLDDIEGLDSIDWLLLDNLNDSLSILENGEQALANTLLVQVRVNFVPTHKNQPELTQISHWLSRHGFSFYRLQQLQHGSLCATEPGLGPALQDTHLLSADVLFVPDRVRMAALSNNQRLKLAFVLHSVYRIRDLAAALLAEVAPSQAERYRSIEQQPVAAAIMATAVAANPVTPVTSAIQLPQAPHMSEAERHLFKKALAGAKSYFEFGSGGSTVWAVREGLTVKGIESDAKWVNALKQALGSHCQVEAVDIGPTREWGYPISNEHSYKFTSYSHAIKSHDYPFDLILVDGRFRVACTATAIQHILDHHCSPEDARIFIHDFWDRPQYHVVLEFLETLERVDTAGLFRLKPDIEREAVEQMLRKYVLLPA